MPRGNPEVVYHDEIDITHTRNAVKIYRDRMDLMDARDHQMERAKDFQDRQARAHSPRILEQLKESELEAYRTVARLEVIAHEMYENMHHELHQCRNSYYLVVMKERTRQGDYRIKVVNGPLNGSDGETLNPRHRSL